MKKGMSTLKGIGVKAIGVAFISFMSNISYAQLWVDSAGVAVDDSQGGRVASSAGTMIGLDAGMMSPLSPEMKKMLAQFAEFGDLFGGATTLVATCDTIAWNPYFDNVEKYTTRKSGYSARPTFTRNGNRLFAGTMVAPRLSNFSIQHYGYFGNTFSVNYSGSMDADWLFQNNSDAKTVRSNNFGVINLSSAASTTLASQPGGIPAIGFKIHIDLTEGYSLEYQISANTAFESSPKNIYFDASSLVGYSSYAEQGHGSILDNSALNYPLIIHPRWNNKAGIMSPRTEGAGGNTVYGVTSGSKGPGDITSVPGLSSLRGSGQLISSLNINQMRHEKINGITTANMLVDFTWAHMASTLEPYQFGSAKALSADDAYVETSSGLVINSMISGSHDPVQMREQSTSNSTIKQVSCTLAPAS
jgi:hypothetical protein